MAHEEGTTPEERNPDLAKSLKKSGVGDKPKAKGRAFYKVLGSTKIPVSRSYGPLWKSRRDASMTKRKSSGVEQSWDEALKYFHNDQLGHRKEAHPDTAGNESLARRRNRIFTMTENIVFANTRSLVPALYAKNPRVEFTTRVEGEPEAVDAGRKLATLVERVVNAIITKKTTPGVNLKPKARRAVIMTTLTNRAWIEVGYTFRTESSEQALKEIQALAAKLAKAKTQQEIGKIEGALMAAEKAIDVLQPAGPWVKYRRPHAVLVDPDAQEEDASDANWMMVADFLPTEFIAAKYAKDSKDGDHKSLYEPTHIIKAKGSDSGTLDDEVNNFTIISDAADWKKLGFDDEDSFRRALRTKVWWVWDKVTRRVFLYNDKAWTWPLWVWDDPYHLDTFFPLFPLSFYTDPESGDTRGEVTYYLDQQDVINEVNDERRRIVLAMKRGPLYNKNVIPPEVMDAWLSGNDTKAQPVDLPEGQKISDHIETAVPPAINFPQVFTIENELRAIDRIGSSNDVIRGVQFKTNTTNKAIESYEASSNTVLDEKVDAVEDFIGGIGWALAQLALQFLEKEQIEMLVGSDIATEWENMQPDEIQKRLAVRVVGGSTSKPTSQAKKREAIEVGQVLGQFVQISPVALEIALRALEQAFDEVTIKEEDWQVIRESIKKQLEQEEQGGDAQGGEGAQGGAQDPIAQIAQLINTLPDPAKQALGQAIAQGVPVEQALQQIMQTLQQSGGERGATQQ